MKDNNYYIAGVTLADAADQLYREMAEYSFLTPLLARKDIEEININAWDDIQIIPSKGKPYKLEEHFTSPQHALDVVRRMLHNNKLVFDASRPLVTGFLDKNIIYAVEQSIDYINPPVQQAFRKFLTQTKLINSNVKLAIEQLKGEINNEIFHEWCDSLIECQDNVTLKKTLQPITTKLSNVRIINAELRNMLMSPRREHVMMVFILLANYPILYFLNSDWFKVLTDTFVGQVVNSIVAIVVIVTVILAYKYTQPIQYKR